MAVSQSAAYHNVFVPFNATHASAQPRSFYKAVDLPTPYVTIGDEGVI
jgi:hypothetical protein